jgi:hypothetical protein
MSTRNKKYEKEKNPAQGVKVKKKYFVGNQNNNKKKMPLEIKTTYQK